jgi:hypothetical protein
MQFLPPELMAQGEPKPLGRHHPALFAAIS